MSAEFESENSEETRPCGGAVRRVWNDSYPFKDEAYLFYIRTQCVPRCKHSPLGYKNQSLNVL
jgi:hypothetical protein